MMIDRWTGDDAFGSCSLMLGDERLSFIWLVKQSAELSPEWVQECTVELQCSVRHVTHDTYVVIR